MTTNIQDLIGKVALVTGAGNPGHLGAVTAQALAEAGASVVLADIPGTKLHEVVESLSSQGLQVSACEVDISDEASVIKLYEFTLNKYKRLDILDNNAGLVGEVQDRDVMSMQVEVWDRTMSVNLRGTMLMCKHALPIRSDSRMVSMAGSARIKSQRPFLPKISGSILPGRFTCVRRARN